MLSTRDKIYLTALKEVATIDSTNMTIVMDEGFEWKDYWIAYYMLINEIVPLKTMEKYATAEFKDFRSALRKIQFFRSRFVNGAEEIDGIELSRRLNLASYTKKQRTLILQNAWNYCSFRAYEVDEKIFASPLALQKYYRYHYIRVNIPKPVKERAIPQPKSEYMVWIKKEKIWLEWAKFDDNNDAIREYNRMKGEGYTVALYYPGKEEEYIPSTPKTTKPYVDKWDWGM